MENGKLIPFVDKENQFNQMEIFMKVNGWKTKDTDLVNLDFMTETYIKENGNIIKDLDKEN